MNLTRKKRSDSVLGLTLDNGRLEAAVLRRTNGSVEVRKFTSTALTLDLMRNEPELVGREIRNLLDAAGIKERRCVVGVPPEWVLSLHTPLPDLPEEDLESFIELEGERGFPANLDQLQRCVSLHRTTTARYATQVAVASDHIGRLEAVLAAAQLRPARISLAIAALPGAIAGDNQGYITALVGESGIAMLVSVAGGIVALRMLDNVFEAESSERRVLADVVARELRITLAQLPDDLRGLLREMHVVGTDPMADHLARELESSTRAFGLVVRRLTTSGGREHNLMVKGEAPLSGALSLAVQYLSNAPGVLNFMPPKPTLWQQISQRYSGKRLAYSGATAGAVAFIALGLFLFQGFQLSGLEKQWKELEPKYKELSALQSDIRTYRPWFDQNVTSLSILRQVTESFPEVGNVTAKAVEIRNQASVNVTGTTTDQTALYAMLNQLRAAQGVRDVKVDTVRGNKPPLQFSFNFQWGGQP